ncbi:unnamed protein product [Leuciscus chuanchicus]
MHDLQSWHEDEDILQERSSILTAQETDVTFNTAEADTSITEPKDLSAQASSPIQKICKYIVYETCIMELFEVCPVCHRSCRIRSQRIGTFLRVEQLCHHCQFSRKWSSQPILGSTPAGNLHLAAAVYLSGASFVTIEKSNEVGGSYHMEKEGLKRGLDFLDARGVTLDCIVTDRHPQIQKFLRERNVNQFYDVWHVEKGISKQLEKVCKLKGCEKIRKWLHSIKKHIYWTAASSSSGPERVAKWTSMLNHMQNKHTHEDSNFPACEQEERVLSNKRILKDVAKLSPHFQTSSIEVFHSFFPFLGMLCRLYLAALHYNENAGRPQATTAAGRPVFKVTFPKAKKGEYRVREVKTQATFRYVDDLLDLIFDKVFVDPASYVDDVLMIPIPPALCAE